MGDSEQMPKVNISDPTKISGLRQSDIDFMKIIEEKNRIRIRNLQKVRKSNIITGSLLGVGVLSIYFYSMFAVKQEHFLDDFNEPEKIHK